VPFPRRHRESFAITADSLDALYRAHARDVLVFFTRRLSDPQASLDLLAETFAAAFAARRSFRGTSEDEAVSWLFGIGRNMLLMHLRGERVRLKALARIPLAPPQLTSPEIEHIETLAATADVRRRLAGALEGLPVAHREAIELRVVDELSYDVIASKLGITEATARARVSRGLRSLNGSLDHIGDNQ
jgi:RNA polymerase sigma-70 factor (ECF subfamily)